MSAPTKPAKPKPAKPVAFRGTALDDLKAFPAEARREAGFQFDQVQNGRDPDDWKPMTTVGPVFGKFGYRTKAVSSAFYM